MMDEYFQSWVFNTRQNADTFWKNWIEENPQKRNEIEEARSTLLRLNFTSYRLPPEDVSRVWDQIRRRDSHAVKASRIPKYSLWYGTAAAILIIGISSLYWVIPQSPTGYATTFGETKTITLPDSSTVILNSNSSLRLNSDWKVSAIREVWLDGEAFFSVTHKKNNQPFKVKTSENVDIEVLGTTFNVYHRHQTKIVLNSGRIQLSLPTATANEKILMKPGELVEYDEKKYVKRTVDPKVYTSWTHNTVLLNRTSLRELLHMIKDNYGVDVVVNESLLDQTISGSMPVTDSESLLRQIAKAFRLTVVKKDDRIYLRE